MHGMLSTCFFERSLAYGGIVGEHATTCLRSTWCARIIGSCLRNLSGDPSVRLQGEGTQRALHAEAPALNRPTQWVEK